MLRQQREAHEQPEEIRENHPLVGEEPREAFQSRALREPGEHELVGRDDREPVDSDPQRVMVEERDPQQDQGEQDEIDGDRPQHHEVRTRAWRRL